LLGAAVEEITMLLEVVLVVIVLLGTLNLQAAAVEPKQHYH
jgi:hypothetical protein